MGVILALGLLLTVTEDPATPPVARHIQKIINKADGLTPEKAFKVSSVREEYKIAEALNLTVESQSLIIESKPYDLLKTIDKDGNARDVWFDISRFYPPF